MTFDPGETVVHARYGVGEFVGERQITRDGETVHYACITLADDRGTLLIPYDQLQATELRPAVDGPAVIREILESEPEALSDHHRSRQNAVEKLMSTGKPRKIAAVLRDLTWRERRDRLTMTDTRLKTKALRMLVEELSMSLKKTVNETRNIINGLLDRAMDHHEADLDEAVAAS